MRKVCLIATGCIALVAFLGLSGQAFAGSAAGASDWNQYGHDARRSSASAAVGPQWPTLVAGWPVTCNCVDGPAVAQLAPQPSTGGPAVFSGSAFSSTLYGFTPAGQHLAGEWPAVLGPSGIDGTLGYPAVGSGGAAIYTTRQGGGGQLDGTIYAVDAAGAPVPGRWPLTVPGYQTRTEPTLATDTSSGKQPDDTLFVGAQSGDTGRLYALKPDGSNRPGWPVNTGYQFSWSGPAVGSDGSVYIASGSCCDYSWELDAFTAAGEPKAGWPFQFSKDLFANYSGPAIGPDGTIYMGIGGPIETYSGPGPIYAFTPEGEVKPGWPVQLAGTPFATPAIASDGTVYVAAHRSFENTDTRVEYMYALDANGNVKSGWPLKFISSGGAGDAGIIAGIAVDGDRNVYFGTRNVLYGYDPDGQPLPGWPIKIAGASFLTPALASDGTLYVVARYNNYAKDKIYALRTGSEVASSATAFGTPTPNPAGGADRSLPSVAGQWRKRSERGPTLLGIPLPHAAGKLGKLEAALGP